MSRALGSTPGVSDSCQQQDYSDKQERIKVGDVHCHGNNSLVTFVVMVTIITVVKTVKWLHFGKVQEKFFFFKNGLCLRNSSSKLSYYCVALPMKRTFLTLTSKTKTFDIKAN